MPLKSYLYTLVNILQDFSSRGGFFVYFSSILARLATAATAVLLSRMLSPENYGAFAVATSIILILAPVSGVGMNDALMRFGSNDKYGSVEKTHLANKFLTVGLISSSTLAVLLAVASLIGVLPVSGKVAATLLVMSPALPLMFALLILGNLHRTLGNNKKYALLNGLNAILLTISSAALAHVWSLTGAAAAWLVSPILCLALVPVKNFGIFRKKLSNLGAAPYRYSLWVTLGALTSQGTLYIDVIMLGSLGDDIQAGLFRNASIITISLMFLPSTYIASEFIHIAQNSHRPGFIWSFYKRFILLFAPIVIAVTALFFFFAEIIVTFLFGDNFLGSAVALKWLAIGLPISFLIRVPIGNILNASGHADQNLWVGLLAFISCVVANYILIPKYGIIGASAASLIALGISSILQVFLFLKLNSNINKHENS